MNGKQLEVLNRVHDFLGILIREGLIKDAPALGEDEPALVVSDLADDVYDAIHNFPARNCDVGTEKEQVERFDKFCLFRKCNECQLNNDANFLECGVRWGQMPYEKGEPDEQK